MVAGRVQMDRHRGPFSVQVRASSDGNPKNTHGRRLPAPGRLLVNEDSNLGKISGGFLTLPDSMTTTCECHQGLRQRC